MSLYFEGGFSPYEIQTSQGSRNGRTLGSAAAPYDIPNEEIREVGSLLEKGAEKERQRRIEDRRRRIGAFW